MKVLVVNCGSSSIKYQLYEMPSGDIAAKGLIEKLGSDDSRLFQEAGGREIERTQGVRDHKEGMRLIAAMLVDEEAGPLDAITEIGAVGHRVVHGGEAFTGSRLITDDVMKTIEDFFDLAPLHNPPNHTGIVASKALLPDVPHIACFDTAFHQTIKPHAYIYGLPYDLYEKYRVRRYGFHGTSHRYVARRASEILGLHKYKTSVITCHLGNGCSITAVEDGRSSDTSMGLTPLEGVMMGTRSGDIDPAIIFYLAEKDEFDIASINTLMNKQSGLLGVSGVSNDLREVKKAADGGNERAKIALEIYAYKIKKYVGVYAAVMHTVDAVVFTGGVGENAAFMREMICDRLDNIGMVLDKKKNKAVVGREGDVSAKDSPVRLLVIPTNEEIAIARDTFDIAMGKKEEI